jgi:hypothetical protein
LQTKGCPTSCESIWSILAIHGSTSNWHSRRRGQTNQGINRRQLKALSFIPLHCVLPFRRNASICRVCCGISASVTDSLRHIHINYCCQECSGLPTVVVIANMNDRQRDRFRLSRSSRNKQIHFISHISIAFSMSSSVGSPSRSDRPAANSVPICAGSRRVPGQYPTIRTMQRTGRARRFRG